VDDAKDTVKETDNTPEGSSGLILQVDLGSTLDFVISSVKYMLGAYVEGLALTGTANLAGTGNELDNYLYGNDGANTLSGKAGADVLDGGTGADKLSGGTGADTFWFYNLATGGADSISDFTDEDTLVFDSTVFTQLTGATAGNLVNGTKALEADDYLIYNKGKLYYDADGSSSGAAILIVGIKGADAKTFTIEDCSLA
jgi:Ca2+-binding RTX toxin-like protein